MEDPVLNLEDCGNVDMPGLECGAFYARKRGSGHVAGNRPCQDFCIAGEIAPELFFAAVADGHGGEAYTRSDIGARLACEETARLAEEICAEMKKRGADEDELVAAFSGRALKAKLVERWRQAVLEDYEAHPDEECGRRQIIRKYGTTILFVAVTRNYYVLGQLGDGAILLFDGRGHAQLFRRHAAKVGSKTSSLASERGMYALFTDVYERRLFDHVLLSTDGIYDKLDREDSFLRYARTLAVQIQERPKHPFTVEGIDVSTKTGDDCTVVLVHPQPEGAQKVHSQQEAAEALFGLKELKRRGYEKIVFERVCGGTIVLSAEKDSQIYEIHIGGGEPSRGAEKRDVDVAGCRLLAHVDECLLPDGRCVSFYRVPEGARSFYELYENGEMLEKRYLSRLMDAETDSRYSNEYWLKVFENLRSLEQYLCARKAGCTKDFVRTLRLKDDGTLYCFDDGIRWEGGGPDRGDSGRVKEMSAFLGKLRCGKLQCPLYECMDQGQTVKFLHLGGESAPMLRVTRNPEKQIYGLWNISDRPWEIKYPKERVIEPGEVLRLKGNQTFYVACGEEDVLTEADPSGGFVRYETELF